eukprot:11949974-Alexandrium_andersonii.AAC.1
MTTGSVLYVFDAQGTYVTEPGPQKVKHRRLVAHATTKGRAEHARQQLKRATHTKQHLSDPGDALAGFATNRAATLIAWGTESITVLHDSELYLQAHRVRPTVVFNPGDLVTRKSDRAAAPSNCDLVSMFSRASAPPPSPPAPAPAPGSPIIHIAVHPVGDGVAAVAVAAAARGVADVWHGRARQILLQWTVSKTPL